MSSHSPKVVLITGTSSGIGLAAAVVQPARAAERSEEHTS